MAMKSSRESMPKFVSANGSDSLASLFPELSEEFLSCLDDANKNPNNLLPGSGMNCKWKCLKLSHQCGHEWIAPPKKRTGRGDGCPSCSNHQVHMDGRNSLASLHPEIAAEFHSKKNGDLCPTKLLPNANFREAREIIWICKTVSPTPCGNQWKASPNTRVRGHGCCSCANKCVHSEDARNSLAARYPELLKEWNWSKNDVDPFKILPSVKAMFWWTCNTCEIDFHMNGNNRVNGQNCPDCSPVGFQNTEVGFYYVHKITNAEGDFLYYKAGISNDWKRRLIQLRRGIDETHQIEFVECLRFEIGRDARTLEGRLRKIAISEKWKVKNYDFDGGTELFSKNPITRARELSIL